MKRATVFGLVLTAFLVGCATLRPDQGQPAIDSGYPTAELVLGDQRFLGLAMVAAKRGTPYSSLNFAVQGYFDGTMRLVSRDCEIDQTVSYKNHALVSFNLPATVEKNCLYTITVAPEYSSSLRQGVGDIYNFRGHLAVRVTDGEPWVGDARKLTGSWQSFLKVPVQGGTAVRAVLNAGAPCLGSYDDTLEPQNGEISIPIHESIKASVLDLCVLDGFALNAQNDTSLNVLLAVYKTDFSPLPAPVLTVKDGKLTVDGDSNVSIVAMDDNYQVNRKADFDFDASKPHFVRLLTVKGRAALCSYTPAGGFKCQN